MQCFENAVSFVAKSFRIGRDRARPTFHLPANATYAPATHPFPAEIVVRLRRRRQRREEPSVVLNKVAAGKGNYGYNAQTGEYGDMIEFGIMDPTKVTRRRTS
jgi:hypothetical protein